jgi:hypothetical protein
MSLRAAFKRAAIVGGGGLCAFGLAAIGLGGYSAYSHFADTDPTGSLGMYEAAAVALPVLGAASIWAGNKLLKYGLR